MSIYLFDTYSEDEPRFIGLSLSGCVTDILRGKVKESNVIALIAGTAMKDIVFDSTMRTPFNYLGSYWDEFDKETVVALLNKLIPRIVQPRLLGLQAPNISGGHWIKLHKGKMRRVRFKR